LCLVTSKDIVLFPHKIIPSNSRVWALPWKLPLLSALPPNKLAVDFPTTSCWLWREVILETCLCLVTSKQSYCSLIKKSRQSVTVDIIFIARIPLNKLAVEFPTTLCLLWREVILVTCLCLVTLKHVILFPHQIIASNSRI
jgi:hypothetical protein